MSNENPFADLLEPTQSAASQEPMVGQDENPFADLIQPEAAPAPKPKANPSPYAYGRGAPDDKNQDGIADYLQVPPGQPGILGDLWTHTSSAFVDSFAGDLEAGHLVTDNEWMGEKADDLAGFAEGLRSGLSDDAKEAGSKMWVNSFDDRWKKGANFFGDAWGDIDSYVSLIGSAVGSLGSIVAGGGITKAAATIGLRGTAKALGKEAARKAALRKTAKTKGIEAADKQLKGFKKFDEGLDKAIGATSYGAAEAGMTGGAVARDVEAFVMDMPAQTLSDAPLFQETYWGLREQEGMSHEEAFDQARKVTARVLATEGMTNAAIPSLLLGSIGGKFIDDVMKKRLQGSRGARAAKGFGTEAVTEAGQGAAEHLAGEYAKQNVDPTIDPWNEVANAAVSEGLGGGIAGGAMGLASRTPDEIEEQEISGGGQSAQNADQELRRLEGESRSEFRRRQRFAAEAEQRKADEYAAAQAAQQQHLSEVMGGLQEVAARDQQPSNIPSMDMPYTPSASERALAGVTGAAASGQQATNIPMPNVDRGAMPAASIPTLTNRAKGEFTQAGEIPTLTDVAEGEFGDTHAIPTLTDRVQAPEYDGQQNLERATIEDLTPDRKYFAQAEKQGLSRRWGDGGYRYEVDQMAKSLETGGGVSYLYDEHDRITGRTSSVNPQWFQGNGDMSSVRYVRDTVNKALRGEKLGKRQKRIIEAMMDVIDDLNGEYGESYGEYGAFDPDNGVYFSRDARGAVRFNPQDGNGARTVAMLEEEARDAGVPEKLIEALVGRRLPINKHAEALYEATKRAKRRAPAQPQGNQSGTAEVSSPEAQAPEASPRADRQEGAADSERAGLNPAKSEPESGENVAPTEKQAEVEAGANEADTSPTDAQKEAGNYKKGRIEVHGIKIGIENPAGTERSGTDPDGNRWVNTLAHHYGDITGVEGADGDQIDVFVNSKGDPEASDTVYVVDQVDENGDFDEHKVMIGFDNEAAATQGYLDNYDEGWEVGPVTEMSVERFKEWLASGDTTKPLHREPPRQRRDDDQRGIFNRRLEGMTEEELREYVSELRAELLTDERTGLGSNRAWLNRDPKTFVASLDLDSLKWVNDNMGHEAGDQMISLVGDALREAGIGEDSFHVSGDEFYAQSNDFSALVKALNKARKWLDEQTITGNGIEYKGPGFSFGIARDLDEAEQNLQSDKSTREKKGLRAGRGQRPSGALETGRPNEPAGIENRGEETAGDGQEEVLSSYTEDDLREREEKRKAQEQAEAEAEAKAKADAERDDFNLTGSNAPADIAASQGQNSLFGAGGKPTRSDQFKSYQKFIQDSPVSELGKGLDEQIQLDERLSDGESEDLLAMLAEKRDSAPAELTDAQRNAKRDIEKRISNVRDEKADKNRDLKATAVKKAIDKADLPEAAKSELRTALDRAQRQLSDSTAPEHAAVGVDERELGEIVGQFGKAADIAMADDGTQLHHLFDDPAKGEVVRLNDKAKVYHKDHGWMTPAEAKARIAEWKAHAKGQNKSENADKVVISLFDLTGKWSQPWEDAGYQVYRFDIQEGSIAELLGEDINVGDINNFGHEYFADLFGHFDGNDVHAILAACPCTDFASSGARHFAAKDKDGRTVASVRLVQQTLATIEYFKPAVWAIENPVGRIEKLGGLPPWRLSFDPNSLGDPYTKKTLIWGRFNADLPIAPVEPTEGSKMHSQYGGKSLATKNARSATPEGFAYGFFMANNAIDHPILAVANKYDRLDRDLIKQALDAGMTGRDISEVVDDHYYDLDDAAAEQALREAIEERAEEGSDLLSDEAIDETPADQMRKGDIGTKAGKPFKTDAAANAADKRADYALSRDYHLVPVEGGMVFRPKRVVEKDQAEAEAPITAESKEYDAAIRSYLKLVGVNGGTVADLQRGDVDFLFAHTKKQYREGLAEYLSNHPDVAGDVSNAMRWAVSDAGNYSRADQARFQGKTFSEWKEGREHKNDNGGAAPTKSDAPKAQNTKSNFGAGNKVFTADAAEKARQILRAKLAQTSMGLDPELAQAGMTLAGYYIEGGARRFVDYTRSMVNDLGDSVQPYLRQFYEMVRYQPGMDTTGMDDAATIDALEKSGAVDAIVKGTKQENTDATVDSGSGSALEGVSTQESAEAGSEGAVEGKTGKGGTKNTKRPGSAPSGGNDLFGGVGDGEGTVSVSPPGAGSDGKPRKGGVNAAPLDHTIEGELGEGGERSKFNDNIAAIKLLKQLEADGMQANAEQQAVLAKYVGWGGIKQAFFREDGTTRKGWEKQAQELKDLLTADEYDAARRSVLDAHYTSKEVVEGIYTALDHLGFKGGNVLEPSVGVGNFFGLMPKAMRSSSKLTGVELDTITGGIAKQLYPKAKVHAPMGFQKFGLTDGSFDLAIGNPPFGSQQLHDRNRRDISGFSIHNYFFAKSINGLRPGGVLAMVVSKGLMDKISPKQREYMAQRVELLGAVRLPNNAFKKNANTEVTTDILFMRRLEEGETPTTKWTKSVETKGADGSTIHLNEYFVANPDMMLGEMRSEGTMYRAGEAALIAKEGQDTGKLLIEAVKKLPEGVYTAVEPSRPTVEPVVKTGGGIHDAPVNGFYFDGDTLHIRRQDVNNERVGEKANTKTNSKGEEVPYKPAELARIKGMVDVSVTLNKLLRAQVSHDANPVQITALRRQLNKQYDEFQKKYGYINGRANKSLMVSDPVWPRLAALEHNYDAGISAAAAKKDGVSPRPARAVKADIFSKRTQQPYTPVSKVGTAKEGLLVSLSERGRVDMAHIEKIYGKSAEEIEKELDGLIFNDPVDGWVPRDEYLSGNVKLKLAQAEQAAQDDSRYRPNVKALKAVIPADIEAADIRVKMGAPWLPPKIMADFLDHLSGKPCGARFSYAQAVAKWSGDVSNFNANLTEKWGSGKFDALELVLKGANNRVPVVRYKTKEGTFTDTEATEAAQQKLNEIKQEFEDWIWQSSDRREQLGRIYNDTYNTTVKRRFDGSHLQLIGKISDDIITLRPHQKNFVWRVLQSPSALADHVVGAGKTMALVGAAMELKRTGMAKKPMLVVPNHLVQQWSNEFLELYPGANILVPDKKDFQKARRKELFGRIATGDWDAVIVAHSTFKKLPSDLEEQERFIKQQLKDLEESRTMLEASEGAKSRSVRELEKMKETLANKLEALTDVEAQDADGFTFQELGIDALFVDEAHEFKNLQFMTSLGRMPGINPAGSSKAGDMFVKTQSITNRNGRVIFATGTPISNSMAEMYTMQRYLGYNAIRTQGLAHFDAWANVFGEVVTDFELDATGVNYKLNSRFSKFVNMPELMQQYGQFADTVTRDDINELLKAQGKRLPVPKLRTGGPINVVAPRSLELGMYMDEIVKRAMNMPKDPTIDNMLKVTGDARKAALDLRLIDSSAADDPDGKVNQAIDNVVAEAKKWEAERGAQLIFCDLSTPKGAVGKEKARIEALLKAADEGDESAQAELDKMSPDELDALNSDFSVYDDIRAKLLQRGFKPSEVAFIHDANTDLQKQNLFAKVNNGEVRVLIGSTAKMGAGMNAQKRLVALHHLDAPWKPSDLEQREGRIIRQGNELYNADPDNFEVAIYRYATEQTYDSRMWQTIEGKARFIEQLRNGTLDAREVEDVAGESASAAEMKAAASGNPLILEEFKLRAELKKLEGLERTHNRKQWGIEDQIKSHQRTIENSGPIIAEFQKDVNTRDANTPKDEEGKTVFSIQIGKRTHDKRIDAGKHLLLEAARFLKGGHATQTDVGTFRGFPIEFGRMDASSVEITLVGERGYSVEVTDMVNQDPGGLIAKLNNAAGGIEREIVARETMVERAQEELPLLLEQQGAPFGQAERLAEVRKLHSEVLKELSSTDEETKRPYTGQPGSEILESEAGSPAGEGRFIVVSPGGAAYTNQPKEFFDSREAAQAWMNENGGGEQVLEDEAADTARFDASANGATAAVTPRQAREQVRKLEQETGVPVKVVKNEDGLPTRIIRQIDRQGMLGRVRGLYDQKTGKAYVIADNLGRPEEAAQVYLHEVVGHMGIRAALGNALDSTLLDIYRNLAPALKAGLAWKYRRQIENADGRQKALILADEYVALLAESGRDNNGVLAKVVAVVRRWLRKVGLVKEWYESDVLELLAQGKKRLRAGGNRATGTDVRYALQATKQQLQFSKLKTSAGRPVWRNGEVTIHGDRRIANLGTGLQMGHEAHVPDGVQAWHMTAYSQGKAIADLTVQVKGGDIVAVHNIDSKAPGAGEKVIASLLANSGNGIRVIEAVPSAQGFWSKMGANGFFDQYNNTLIHWGDYEHNRAKRAEEASEQGRGGDVRRGGVLPDAAEQAELFADADREEEQGRSPEDEPLDAAARKWLEEFELRYSLEDEPSLDDSYELLGLGPKKGKIKKLVDAIRTANLREWWGGLKERSYEGVFDGLIGIKRAEDAVGKGMIAGDYDKSGYVGARLATGTADLMTAILNYGAPKWGDGGVIEHKENTQGLLEIFSGLGEDLHDWLAWMGGKRGEELMRQGRENNLKKGDIRNLLALANGREPKFEEAQQKYAALNKAMLDLAEGAGLIDPDSRRNWESEWYIPFYRQDHEQNGLLGPRTKRGLSHQASGIKMLRGGKTATNDLMENILANWLKLADASVKNMALLKTVDNLKDSDYLTNESLKFKPALVTKSEMIKRVRDNYEFAEEMRALLNAYNGDTEAALLAQGEEDHTSPRDPMVVATVIEELESMDQGGIEQLWALTAPADPDIVRVKRDGKNEYYRVNDPALLRGLVHLSAEGNNGMLMRYGRTFKRLLTTGVTAAPDFMLRNFIRDAMHAWAINKDGFRFGLDSMTSMKKAFQEDEDYRELMFAMASFQGGYVHGTDPEAGAELIRRNLKRRGMTPAQINKHMDSIVGYGAERAWDGISQVWQKYRTFGDRLENTNRLATFKAAKKAGKSLAQAVYESKDLMDYSLRGNWGAMTVLTDLVPFMNARLQGLSKLARAAEFRSDGTALNPLNWRMDKEMAKALALIASASMLLAMLNGDDDDYQDLPDWEKDAYWHIFLEGQHFRIPKPFEIGIVAGTIPERMMQAWILGNQPDDKVLWSLQHGLIETLNFNPIPQAVLPMVELWGNRSMYFDTPIETMTDQRMLPRDRYNAYTSRVAVHLGQLTGYSPKKLEHLWNGYTGTLGAYTLTATDMLVRWATDAPNRGLLQARDIPGVKSFVRGSGPARSTQWTTDLYDRLEEASQLAGSFKQLDDPRERREFMEKYGEKMRTRRTLEGTAATLNKLRKQRDRILEAEMPKGAKQLKLDAIQKKINDVARRAAQATDEAFN